MTASSPAVTFAVPVLSAWDLLPNPDERPLLLSAWDLLPLPECGGRVGRRRLTFGSPRYVVSLCWALLAGMGMFLAFVRQVLAAEVPYLAHRGESLRQIADRLWGKPEAWRSLWQVNRDQVDRPGFLLADTTLRLPDQPGAPGPLPPNPVTVQPGDTLWDLSGRIYGDAWAWPVIWGANRDAVTQPHWIYPRQRLRWPSRGTLHVVRAGETWRTIARQHYGAAREWGRLWAANRGWLGGPDRLRPGLRLWVPQADRRPG